MGTETWIISLPLSDSILYLKIIHPPNFREEPIFWLSYRISMLELSVKDYLVYCGMMSMDIYILSDIIKIPFRIILWNKMHFYTGTFLVGIIMGIGLSMWVSRYIIRRNNILKRLMLGM